MLQVEACISVCLLAQYPRIQTGIQADRDRGDTHRQAHTGSGYDVAVRRKADDDAHGITRHAQPAVGRPAGALRLGHAHLGR